MNNRFDNNWLKLLFYLIIVPVMAGLTVYLFLNIYGGWGNSSSNTKLSQDEVNQVDDDYVNIFESDEYQTSLSKYRKAEDVIKDKQRKEMNKKIAKEKKKEKRKHEQKKKAEQQRKQKQEDNKKQQIKNKDKQHKQSSSNKQKINNNNKSQQQKNNSSSTDNNSRSGDWRTFEVTAYSSGVASTGKSPSHPDYGKTASGNQVQSGYTLACPPSLPFGTKIYIPDMNNTYVCHDRGNDITDNRLDIYMNSADQARSFGRQSMKVKILN